MYCIGYTYPGVPMQQHAAPVPTAPAGYSFKPDTPAAFLPQDFQLQMLPGQQPLQMLPGGQMIPTSQAVMPTDTLVPHTQAFKREALKRGSDELLSQSPLVANGNGMSPQMSPGLESNDAKKAKLDQNSINTGPSKVVHIRSVPMDATEAEVVQLGLPFGKCCNVMLMKKKGQAFLMFDTVAQASAMVNYYTAVTPLIRGRRIYLQYSTHQELKTDQNPSAQAALQAATVVQLQTADGGEQKKVLHVTVTNLVHPIVIDTLKQIFSRYGQVMKIVTFLKNNEFQALIQFSDAISAQTAKSSLDGQNIYNGCCTLKIDFSKLSNLNIRFNNEKSRDYTNPNLPMGDGTNPMEPNLALGPHQGMLTAPYATMQSLGAPQLNPYSAAAAGAVPISAASMGLSGLGGLGGIPGAAMPNFAAVGGLAGLAGMGGVGGMGGMAGLASSLSPTAIGAVGGIRLPGQLQTNAVLLVSNLNEQMVTPDALFTLFGVYGDVHRVKILFNKKDNALIQFAEPQQAHLAMTHLDKIKVWGKSIRVAPSKHPVVQMPTEQQTDGGKLTKDYTNSPLHRFKKKGSKNYQNIYPPSATLHLSNIPPDVKGEDLQEAFRKTGGTVVAFKFFEKDHKMALIQMGSIDDAVMALIGTHNLELGENKTHLKVAFSKFYI